MMIGRSCSSMSAICSAGIKQNIVKNRRRTQVLVDPKDATLEHAEKLRQRYKLNYCRKAVGGVKKHNTMYVDNDSRGFLAIYDISSEDASRLAQIIEQADKQLLSRPIEGLSKQLRSQLKEFVYTVLDNKP